MQAEIGLLRLISACFFGRGGLIQAVGHKARAPEPNSRAACFKLNRPESYGQFITLLYITNNQLKSHGNIY